MLSPGEQPRSLRLNSRSALVLLLFTALLAAFLHFHASNLKEYRLYLTEDRKAATLNFANLSEEWTEANLRNRYAGYPVSCHPYQGKLAVQRACAVDVRSYNGVPTLFMSFFFADGHLSQISINVPWWSHDAAYRSLVANLGQPAASQLLPRAGVRLHGWPLTNGSAVFFNRDLPLNPLSWNSIHWRSASSCLEQRCFTKSEP
jgi:hypothetical protein